MMRLGESASPTGLRSESWQPARRLTTSWRRSGRSADRRSFPKAELRVRIGDRSQKLKDEPDNLAYFDDLAVAYNLLVSIYVQTDRLPEALKELDTVLAKNPQYAPALSPPVSSRVA